MVNYAPATSAEVDVTIVASNVVTQLTATASVSTAEENEAFAIVGVLSGADGTTPAGQTIQLQVKTDAGFVDIDGATAETDSSGAYSISVSEAAEGIAAFQAVYAGGSV